MDDPSLLFGVYISVVIHLGKCLEETWRMAHLIEQLTSFSFFEKRMVAYSGLLSNSGLPVVISKNILAIIIITPYTR